MSRAFTLIDLAAAVAGTSVFMLLAFAAIQPDTDAGARKKSQQAADAAHIRGIGQALIIWANNHADSYPLPSEVDKNDATIGGGGPTKNTTANIYSLMVYSGAISADTLLSPLETNPNIVKCESYQFKEPKGAASPERALWDPAFAADFTGDNKGNVSYPHQQPVGERLANWSNSFSTTEVAVGTRGPEIDGIDRPVAESTAPRFASPPVVAGATPAKGTRTCGFYGEGSTWTGNFAYNDNSVRLLKPGLTHGEPIAVLENQHDFPTYVVNGRRRPDVPFYDEPDDVSQRNNYVGIFIQADADRGRFKAIWD